MSNENIEILYEEPHFILANKPAGLFSQAAPGIASLEVRLAEQIKFRDQHPGNPFVGLPHRLDRATSGIMLIARNRRALARFGQQFQSRKVNKYYLAIVVGEVSDEWQMWEDFVLKEPDRARVNVVSADTPSAKLAQLKIRGLAAHEGRTLALVQLLTGRMHQIRVQAAQRGMPVIDDRIYGANDDSGNLQLVNMSDEALREAPQALHALRLEFRHPQTARWMAGTASVPNSWADYIDGFQQAISQIESLSRESQHPWSPE